jgi:catabolite repression HPr-like protein
MISKTFTVKLPNYSEAKAATGVAQATSQIVQIACQFESTVHIISHEKKINAKSIMGMMSLGLCSNDEMQIEANGADEEQAAEAILSYVGSLAN